MTAALICIWACWRGTGGSWVEARALQVISDLLKPERHNLTIKEDKKRGVFVDGLSEWVVRSPQEVRHPIPRYDPPVL